MTAEQPTGLGFPGDLSDGGGCDRFRGTRRGRSSLEGVAVVIVVAARRFRLGFEAGADGLRPIYGVVRLIVELPGHWRLDTKASEAGGPAHDLCQTKPTPRAWGK